MSAVTGTARSAVNLVPLVEVWKGPSATFVRISDVRHLAVRDGSFDWPDRRVRDRKLVLRLDPRHGDKLLIKPARKSVQRLLNKVREVLGKNKAATQAQVIMLLNPILRGWAMYHRHVVAAATFSRIDHLVWTKLWVWAKRRHPRKNARWIKARYFERRGLRDWIFACAERPEGLAFQPTLFRLAGLAIKRHTKVRSNANPFDPAWDAYFQRRAYGC